MKLNLLLIASTLALSFSALASEAPLEEQLKAVELPGNQAPTSVSKEKLYVYQTRYLPLRHKSEVSLGFGQNLTGPSFFTTRQFEVGYRFHLNDTWSLGFEQSFVSNDLTSDGQRLFTQDHIVPDMAYARQRSELTAGYNVFYGKLRFSADSVLYFDQYIALGGGIMMMNTGNLGAAVGDVGFAFWLGQWGSARIGFKDYFFNEPSRSSSFPSNNLHAHLDLGYIF